MRVSTCQRCGVECPPAVPSFYLNDDPFGVSFFGRFSRRDICGVCAAELLRTAAARCEQVARRWDAFRRTHA